jgi:predicted dehydrogenase
MRQFLIGQTSLMSDSFQGIPAAAPTGLRAGANHTVRVGFVGSGGIAAYHMANLAKLPEARIVAICDLNLDAARQAWDRLGTGDQSPAIYEDYRRMLGEEDIDALYICVPPNAHQDAEILAARRGVHLFVEKPVAMDLPLAERILSEIRSAGVIAAAGYLLRYWPSTQVARKFLATRRISMVGCDRWGGIPGGPDFWWRNMECSGGQLHEMTTHQVDLMRYLAGEIVRVDTRHSSGVLRDLPGVTVPDSQVALLEFASGAIGYVSNTCALTTGARRSRLEFVLRDHVLSWGEALSLDPPDSGLLPDVPAQGKNIDEAFIDAIVRHDCEFLYSPYEEAVRTLAVTIAARESAQCNAPVDVTLLA